MSLVPVAVHSDLVTQIVQTAEYSATNSLYLTEFSYLGIFLMIVLISNCGFLKVEEYNRDCSLFTTFNEDLKPLCIILYFELYIAGVALKDCNVRIRPPIACIKSVPTRSSFFSGLCI